MEYIEQNAAEIIAICAMITTVYQAWISRRHNRLSVMPHLTAENNKVTTPQFAELSATLKNKGIGPAIIEEFTVFLEGKQCEPNAAVANLFGNLQGVKTVSTLAREAAMSAGEERVILYLKFPVSSPDDVERIAAKANKLDLLVRYRFMYGKKLTYDSRVER